MMPRIMCYWAFLWALLAQLDSQLSCSLVRFRSRLSYFVRDLAQILPWLSTEAEKQRRHKPLHNEELLWNRME
jgi:hypothetical protein